MRSASGGASVEQRLRARARRRRPRPRWRSASAPRSVMRSGAPGPAPTRITRPRFTARRLRTRRPQDRVRRRARAGRRASSAPSAARLRARAEQLCRDDARAVGRDHARAHAQPRRRSSARPAPRAARCSRAPSPRGDGALGGDARRRSRRGRARPARAASGSPRRACTASAPCADGGQQDLRVDAARAMRCGESEPLEPGAGEHHRVEALAFELAQPRRHVAAQRHDLEIRAQRERSCAARRTLPVPTRAPRGRLASARARRARHQRVARIGALRETPPARAPRCSAAGRSLALCTATSARPSSSASSISFTNRPLPPTLRQRHVAAGGRRWS